MDIQLGFTKGMSQDVSPVKRDKDSYYEALNIRVVTSEGNSTGSITNDLGNSLLFKLPKISKSVVVTNITSNSVIKIKINDVQFVGNKIPVTIVGNETPTDGIYRALTSNSTIATWITTGKLYIKNNRTSLTIVILDDYLASNTITGTDCTVTSIAPGSSETPTIVNYTQMRDSLILFTTFTTGGYGQIWKLDYDFENNTITNLNGEYLTVKDHLVYLEILNFPLTYRSCEVISKYNNPTYGKVYWSNGTALRHLNILDSDVLGTPLSQTELLPIAQLNAPRYVNVEDGGSLKAGMIQYAYQLYNYGGAETLMSPSTPLYHIVSVPTSEGNTTTYRGDVIETNCNKSIRLRINNIDLGFEYIKIWSVFYAQKGSPVINLISEEKITNSTLEFVDNGTVSLDTLTQAEFASFGGSIYAPKSLATKDNYLIAGNVTEDIFDIDEAEGYWDSRAYRWKNVSGTYKAKVDGTEYTDVTFMSQTANCIYEDSYYTDGFKYKKNSLTLGGEGTNISYQFKLIDITIDSSNNNATTTFVNKASNLTFNTWINNQYDNVTNEFLDNSSPYMAATFAGYQPRETYRFGIEFFDSKNRRSFVKWIADIRFPDYDEYPSIASGKSLAYNSGSDIKSSILGIEFTVKNVPIGYSYRIVRVERLDKDKTVVDTIALRSVTLKDNMYYTQTSSPSGKVLGSNTSALSKSFVAVSPNTCFRNVTSLTNYNLEQCGYLNGVYEEVKNHNDFGITMPDNITISYKFYKSHSFVSDYKHLGQISDSIVLGDSYYTSYTLTGYTYPFYNSSFPSGMSNAFVRNGRGIYFRLSASSTGITGVNNRVYIAHVVSPDMTYSRYGGATFAARSRNDYIPCTDRLTSTTATVFRGDVYNQMFDYQSEYTSTNVSENEVVVASTTFIPLISTLNTALRHDTCVSRTSNANQVWKLQDRIATGIEIFNNIPEGETGLGDYPTTYTDMYLINPVYNMQNTTVRGFAKPLGYVPNNSVDYRIISSQQSTANEAVDSWTKFYASDYIDLDSQHGAINKLVVNNNILLAFQDSGFAAVAFKDRQLLNDNLQGQLVLGTGSILSYVRYISTNTGTRNKWSVVELDSNIMWFDTNNRKIMRYGENLEILSDSKNMTSFFKSAYPKIVDDDFTTGVHAVVDKKDNRVYFTFLKTGGAPVEGVEDITISYNLMLGAFESLHSFAPTMFLQTELGLLSKDKSTGIESCWLHGDTNNYNSYYGVVYDSSITHMAGSTNKASWTNLEFNSDDVEPDYIKFYNSYGSNASTGNANLVRRFRTYRTPIPRYVDGSNQRFVDYWIKVNLTYSDKTALFRLDDITLKYLIPLI